MLTQSWIIKQRRR